MRPGPPRGATSTSEVTVTPEMTTPLDRAGRHDVYSTVSLVTDLERLCRDLLLPHLEAGEEAVSAAIEVHLRSPVPVGETIVLTATVASVGPTRLVCEIQARHAGGIVARGSFEQRLIDADALSAEIGARRSLRPLG